MGRNKKQYQYIQLQVLPVEGEPYTEVVPRQDFLQHARDIIGGYVTAVNSMRDRRQVLLLDEDGHLKQLPRNARASLHYSHPLVGTTILLTEAQWRRAMRDK